MKQKLLFNNTYEKGSITYLVIPKKDRFIGVCLEFDLEVQAKTVSDAFEQLKDYAQLWIKNARKNKLPEEVLNKPAPKKYWNIYEKLLRHELQKLEAEKKASSGIELAPQPVVSCQSSYPNFAFA